ncbi:MAG: family transporter protein, partial [Bryobacterales bacterium]|nr:family transporter protein [Bryobacterales bacterium]
MLTGCGLSKFDWRNLTAERAPLAVAVLLGLTIAYGAFNGSRWVQFRSQAIQAALTEEHVRLNEIRADIVKVDAGVKEV